MSQIGAEAINESVVRKWKRYPAYKDSGVEWLGEIPAHWEVWKISHAYKRIGSGTTPATNDLSFYDGGIPWVNTSELRENVITDTTAKLTECALKEHSVLSLYPPGTLLVAMYGATIGRLGILGVTACTNQACCALADPVTLDTKFTFYWLGMRRQEIIVLSSGGGQPNINQEKIRAIRIPAPSLFEQQAIASFLDHETTKIDTLIAKKEQLIQLLQEKRTALISHAVTKGLNPDVPMKDSGIEWLGEIPTHWNIKRVKYCLRSIEQGWSPSCENRIAEDDEWGVLKVGCVNGTEFNPEENKALPGDLEPRSELEIKPGDVLISRVNTRELLGSASVVKTVRPRLLLCDKLYRLQVSISIVNLDYLVLSLSSAIARFQMERDATGASNSMQNIGQDSVLNLVLPLPNLVEQQAIASFLDRETTKLDALIAKIHTDIEQLKEYRTALISSAVTGKIDVREIANAS